MSIPGSVTPLFNTGAAAGGYQIERSIRFNSSDSAYLSRTPASAGNRSTFTWAGWLKRSTLSATTTYQQIFSAGTTPSTRDVFFIDTDVDDTLAFYSASGLAGTALMFQTNAVFRDPSAWYHIVLAIDTTQATAANRVKLYVNGVEQSFATVSYPSQNATSYINGTSTHNIGAHLSSGEYLNGLLADCYLIDGAALTPSSFTETDATTGQLIPKAFSGSYGSQGWHLEFADNSSNTATTLGKDTSGNGNNWTPNNLSVTAGAGNDSLVDTPTSYGTDTGAGGEVRGNYCTLNPLLTGNGSYSNGNLDSTFSSGSAIGYGQRQWGTIGVSSGKWYFEYVQTSGNSQGVGIKSTITTDNLNNYAYVSGALKLNASGSTSSYGAAFTTNDVIGVAFDLDGGTITFYLNGTSQGQAFSGIPLGTYFPYLLGWAGGNSGQSVNFGQRPFAYPVSGFKALCDTNLPAPVVAKPNTVMDVKLYTGNGGTQSITGLGFSPDLVWIKARSAAYSHLLADSVRGPLYILQSDGTSSEQSYGCVNSFDSTGFTVDMDGSIGANNNGTTFAAWCWDAGTSTVTNTQGSITGGSQVRANATAGFSIVTYTGNLSSSGTATVGHGLGVAPQMVITKRRNGASDWVVQHVGLPSANNIIYLNSTSATSTSGYGTIVAPTSSVFTTAWITGLNTNGDTHVAYCFAPVVGYSSVGSYVGNGSSDGVFVYTGFRPRFILVKNATSAYDWRIHDTARDTYNVAQTELFPSGSYAEAQNSLYYYDILSNGFKLRTSDIRNNRSGDTYIYYAVAESPFNYARAR